MTAYLDTRPAGVDVPFRPGNSLPVDVTGWPAGSLTGRTFTSTLDGVALSLLVVGDVIMIEATEAQTAAVTSPAVWLLTETTGGATEDLLIGTWSPSTRPGTATSVTVPIVVDDIVVEVTVSSGTAALIAHNTATQVGSTQLHGVIEHRWATSGWTPFSRKIITQSGTQALTLSVSGDYGRITSASGSSDGDQREIYVHAGMTATAGELTAIIRGPSFYGTGNRPQGGLCLGYQLIDGFHCAFVVWYDIVVSNPRLWNLSGWRGNGGSTLNQATGGQHIGDLARDVNVISARRFNFGSWINELTCVPSHTYGIVAGDNVTVDIDDATFDATAVAVSNVGRETGTLQYVEDVTTSAVSVKFASGTVQLSDGHKRFFPLCVKARRIGAQVSIKVWRALHDPEPRDWQLHQTVTADADFPTLPSGEVPWGIVVGHPHSGSYLDYGDLLFRRLS